MKNFIFSTLAFCLMIGSAVSQEDPTPASLYNDGLTALKAKDYMNAFKLMSEALEMADPEADEQVISLAKKNGSIAAYYYGNNLYKEKKMDAAIEVHNQGIELNPKFYGNYSNLGKIFNSQDNIVESVKAYLTAGDVRVKAGSADKAETYFNRANNIVAIAYSKDMIEETIEGGKMIIEKNETADANYYVAKALKDKDSYDESLTFAQKAADLGGTADESKFIFLVAECFEALGNNAEAIQYYKKVEEGKYYEAAQYKVNNNK